LGVCGLRELVSGFSRAALTSKFSQRYRQVSGGSLNAVRSSVERIQLAARTLRNNYQRVLDQFNQSRGRSGHFLFTAIQLPDWFHNMFALTWIR
jgi:hypothetical protein